MAVQRPTLETILKQLSHQRLGFCQRDQAITDVPGRQNAQLTPQPAGTSAVVEDRHHRGEVVGGPLQATQQRGETRATADDDDAWTAAPLALLRKDVDQSLLTGREERADDGADRPPQTRKHSQQPAGDERHAKPGGGERAATQSQRGHGETEHRELQPAQRPHVHDQHDARGQQQDAGGHQHDPPLHTESRGQPLGQAAEPRGHWATPSRRRDAAP